MGSEQWQLVERIFHDALELPPDQRSRFLDGACNGDAEMRAEIETLLAADVSVEALPAPFLQGRPDLTAGSKLDHYEIFELIGEGGMGRVYRARDTESGQVVAIKVFPPFATPDSRRRILREAQALSALHHPGIVSVHGVASAANRDYLVMEYVAGRTLGEIIPVGGLSIATVLSYARMIAAGLVAAHSAGIVHRDLKPANLIVSDGGPVKILDFGLAKLTQASGTPTLQTATGQIVGTAAYLSPEQAEGQPVDARTDLFSFGVVLYEAIAGARAFDRSSFAATLSAILRDAPIPLARIRSDVPPDLVEIVDRCLQKDRERRYSSAEDLLAAILACQSKFNAPPSRMSSVLRRKAVLAPIVAGLLIVAASATYFGVRWARTRWARQTIEPRIAKLVEQRRYNAADELVRRIETIVPDDQPVREFHRDYQLNASVVTTPPGSELAIKDYMTPDAPWRALGKAPLTNATLPLGYMRWRVSAPGYRTREFAETGVLQPVIRFALFSEASSPSNMVRVPDGTTFSAHPVQVPAFWLDQFEVSNRSYLEFIQAGGYRRRDFWREPFVDSAGGALTWDQAMQVFRDQTGVPAPGHWQLGNYPEGQADLPVTGVSWYEAAAYAQFAGKSLPTYFHWRRAAATEWLYADAVLLGNFLGRGLLPVGSHRALDRFGTYDLGGNAKEWIWNQIQTGKRLLLGGAWNEPTYASGLPDAVPPLARPATAGFRCAKYDHPLPASLTAAVVEKLVRDYAQEKPVGDQDFEPLRKVYDYPAAPLHATVSGIDESSPYWRREQISFDAAYGAERITAYLFVPRHTAPPYQTVVYFPSGVGYSAPSSSRLEMWYLDPLIRTGRAVLYPVVWGMYERKGKTPGASRAERLRTSTIRQILDIRRSVDYLNTRRDVDPAKIAYLGFSTGSIFAPIVLAADARFQAAILMVGGLEQKNRPNDTDPFQFAPRVHIPVLMLNGRYEVAFPLETSQQPLFNSLGTAPADKKLVLLEGGHALVGYPATTRESLAWLDRYLGPIRK